MNSLWAMCIYTYLYAYIYIYSSQLNRTRDTEGIHEETKESIKNRLWSNRLRISDRKCDTKIRYK